MCGIHQQSSSLPNWCICASYICQTTAFCRHSNTHCQSDAQQFWRQSQNLCHHRTTNLAQSETQSQTMWAVIWPVQAVTGDIIIRRARPRRSVNCFNCAEQKYSYLLTKLLGGTCPSAPQLVMSLYVFELRNRTHQTLRARTSPLS